MQVIYLAKASLAVSHFDIDVHISTYISYTIFRSTKKLSIKLRSSLALLRIFANLTTLLMNIVNIDAQNWRHP